MTRQGILEKAIQKAIEAGWDTDSLNVSIWQDINTDKWTWNDGNLDAIIFNHGFAKALWGEEPSNTVVFKPTTQVGVQEAEATPMWQYHLQQMVIAEDPIKYLGEHLNV